MVDGGGFIASSILYFRVLGYLGVICVKKPENISGFFIIFECCVY